MFRVKNTRVGTTGGYKVSSGSVERFRVQRSGLKAIISLYLNNPGFKVFMKSIHPMGHVNIPGPDQ
jgi:hypothetical protein